MVLQEKFSDQYDLVLLLATSYDTFPSLQDRLGTILSNSKHLPITFGQIKYFPFRVRLKSNPSFGKIGSTDYTISEVIKRCRLVGGVGSGDGIMVSFGDGNRDFLLKFGEFLNMKKASGVQFVDPTKDHLFHPLQLWGIVRGAGRIQAIRRSMANLSNHSRAY